MVCVGFMAKMKIEHTSAGLLLLMSLLLLLAASQLSIIIVNFFSTLLVTPRLLPRMDFSDSIPGDCKTLVVIPTMLSNPGAIDDLVESLEVRYLANKDDNIRFGLLTDFTDARQENMPNDVQLLALVQNKIGQLKRKYENGNNETFYLFHRPRRYNVQDKIWMGYERKRGKLGELNALLRGGSKESFSLISGDIANLQDTRFVITLDSDTQLPRGAAWKMIATMAHPLNHPYYDEAKKRVTEGYGLLQPRVTVSLPETGSTFYSRLHGNDSGIDPYTQATSDVYQDMFGEGSFIGKGIYELDTFEKTLKGKFRENRILSHDLLEGCYVRSGLISNVELFEKYPPSYQLDMERRYRWTRGDWQIFLWFTPFIANPEGNFQKNPLSTLSRWKIFDNIRRSLTPIALMLLILLGCTVLNEPLFWTIATVVIIIFPMFITLLWDAFKRNNDIIFTHHIYILLRTAGNIVTKTLFTLVCLPYEAYTYFMAISRTSWKMLVSHKKMLEWNPSTHVAFAHKNSLPESYLTMWVAPFIAITLTIYQSVYAPFGLFATCPFLLLWIISPYLTWAAGRPGAKQKEALTDTQNTFLLKMARKTWAYFERFVGPADNWLPPDNFQQHPVAVVAHRTSPTNIGLSILSGMSAHDFGYSSLSQLLERTEGCFATLQKMERFRGHFYNWYDTETLAPLLPRYVSTVDSGNLAAHVLTFRQGLFEALYEKIIGQNSFQGLLDTVLVLKDELKPDEAVHLKELIAPYGTLLH